MSTTSSEIWNNILKNNVGKDDPLWKEYLDKAAIFDVRMVDEWNKIVDVLLVYVALFISVLTSFIIQTLPQFQRNPADITNELLFAIYNLSIAQFNNTSIPPLDPTSNPSLKSPIGNYDDAVFQNALLYTCLTLCIIVSVIALVAKLWLVSYSQQAFSVGSPYDRAMKRQEAYNGVLVWNMGGVINMLPVILLVALCLFGFYVYTSIYASNTFAILFDLNPDDIAGAFDNYIFINHIGFAVEVLLSVGVMFVGFTSLGGAFISGCPFRSALSGVIRLIFESFQTLSKRITFRYLLSKRLRWLLIGTFAILWVASYAATVILVVSRNSRYGSDTWFPLFFFPAAVPIAFLAQQDVVHKPQKYKIPRLATWAFLFISLSMISAIYFGFKISIPLYFLGVLGFVFACWMFSKMSKSMADTGEIDAIAWLLITAPPQDPATFFKKAGQLTGLDSIGRHYRPRLLESLMPLLTLLITSYHTPEHHSSDTHSPSSKLQAGRSFKIELKLEQPDDVSDGQHGRPTSPSVVDDDMNPMDELEDPHLKNLEIYTACLARLSEFTDYKGSFWCLREDAMQHPKLEQPLIDKLVAFANPRHHFQDGLRSAATKVLNNYELDMEGKPATDLCSVSTVLRSTATLMLNVNGLNSQDSEQGHPNLHRLVDPTTRVEPSHSSGDIEEVKREPEIGDYGIC